MRFLDRIGSLRSKLELHAPAAIAMLFLIFLGVARTEHLGVALLGASLAGLAAFVLGGRIERRLRKRNEEETATATLRKKIGEGKDRAQHMLDSAKQVGDAVQSFGVSSRQPVEAAATSIEEVSVSIAALVERAEEAQQLTQDALLRAASGVRIVLSARDLIQHVADTVNESAAAIQALHQKSSDIVGIVAVIKDIADQTKLLSLNAAIEAARAGKHGRGFTVVADAVRGLAERTANSTREVARIVTGIQHETTRAVTAMEQAYAQVGSGSALSQEAALELGRIHEGATSSVQTVQEIAAATRALQNSSLDIAQHIGAIAQGARKHNKAAKLANASTTELLADLEALRALLSGLELDGRRPDDDD